jgi:hypothetical protein
VVRPRSDSGTAIDANWDDILAHRLIPILTVVESDILAQWALTNSVIMDLVFSYPGLPAPALNAIHEGTLDYSYGGVIPTFFCPQGNTVSGSGQLEAWPYDPAQVTDDTRGVQSSPLLMVDENGVPRMRMNLNTSGALGSQIDPCHELTFDQTLLDNSLGPFYDALFFEDYSIQGGSVLRSGEGGVSPQPSVTFVWSDFLIEDSPFIPLGGL